MLFREGFWRTYYGKGSLGTGLGGRGLNVLYPDVFVEGFEGPILKGMCSIKHIHNEGVLFIIHTHI